MEIFKSIFIEVFLYLREKILNTLATMVAAWNRAYINPISAENSVMDAHDVPWGIW